MKSFKKIFAVVLALCLLLTIVACNNNNNENNENTNNTNNTNNSNTKNDNTSTSDKENSKANDKNEDENNKASDETYSLPIVEPGSVTLSIANRENFFPEASYADNLPVFQQIEKDTGVTIDWQIYPGSDYDQAMQIRMASGQDMPDIFRIFSGASPVKLAEDKIAVPLNDLIDKYAPNIKERLAKDDLMRKVYTAPDGNIYYVGYTNMAVDYVPINVPFIRTDWVEKLGLSMPETIDDWYNVLLAFKTQDPNGNGAADEVPFMARNQYHLTVFASGFGFPSFSGFHAVDGEVQYIPYQDEYKEALIFLNKLYQEGLLDSRLFVKEQKEIYAAASTDSLGASMSGTGIVISCNESLASAGKEGHYERLAPPKTPDGEITIYRSWPHRPHKFFISADSEYQDIAIKWLDYAWADEDGGRRYISFGLEGKSYTIDGDGNIEFTDFVLNNPDGLEPYNALRSLGAAGPMLFNEPEELFKAANKAHPEVLKKLESFHPYLKDSYPDLIGTLEEESRIVSLTADINTYTDEMFARFVMGVEPIENFDTFREELKNMGIEEYTSIRQAQYDRFTKN